jgi:hypothetical protein
LCSLSIGSRVAHVLAHGVHEQLAGHDQRFLVRQQDFLAGARRGQGRGQAGGADDGGHHGVGVRAGSDVAQRLLAVDVDRQAGQQLAQAGCRLGRADHGALRAEGAALGRQFVDAACALSA